MAVVDPVRVGDAVVRVGEVVELATRDVEVRLDVGAGVASGSGCPGVCTSDVCTVVVFVEGLSSWRTANFTGAVAT